MIPNTFSAVICFALLIAPGIVWEIQKSKHEPSEKQTTLLELSRIILASFLATLFAALLLTPYIWMPLYDAYMEDPQHFVATPYILVSFGFALLFNSIAACLISLIYAFLKWPRKAEIQGVKVWHRVFAKSKPESCDKPFLIIELIDGTIWRGRLQSFDSGPEDTQRDLALCHPLARKRVGEKGYKDISDNQRFVVLAESQIRSMQVAFPK